MFQLAARFCSEEDASEARSSASVPLQLHVALVGRVALAGGIEVMDVQLTATRLQERRDHVFGIFVGALRSRADGYDHKPEHRTFDDRRKLCNCVLDLLKRVPLRRRQFPIPFYTGHVRRECAPILPPRCSWA